MRPLNSPARIALCALGLAGCSNPAARPIAVGLTAADGAPAFRSSPNSVVESRALVGETDGGVRVLTLCFSDTAGACRGAARALPRGNSYLLLVDVKLSSADGPVRGEYADIGVIVLTGSTARYSAQRNIGSVVVRDEGRSIVGELRIRDSRVRASGHFAADVAPMEPHSGGSS